jgi:DNA-binding MarR family transcriptional regulator
MQLDPRAVNLVGAWALGAAHSLQTAIDAEVDGSGALAAAILTIALFPDQRVDTLHPVLGLSPSGVVRTLDRLVDAGLAERRTGADDGREVLIRPTRRGARLAERALAARAAAATDLLEPLTVPEREQFLVLLEKLLTGLAPDRPGARHICRLCDHPACERAWCPVSAGAPGEGHRSHPVARASQ